MPLRWRHCCSSDAVHHPTFGGYGLAIWLTYLVGINEVAIVGADGERGAMERVIWEGFRPDIVIASSDASDSVVPLLAGRAAGSAASTPGLAYVCRQLVCELPVDSVEELRTTLQLGAVSD